MVARAAALLALFLALAPPAWAQVGVVTALSGRADLKRPQLPQAALKLRDPVAVRDVVETREESLARLLLLGKATVTVRELSRFEVREEKLPNGAERAGVDLVAGRIRVMVARRLMKPGDDIQVRTPNAVAGVRGSDGIIEVTTLADGTPRTVVTGISGEFEVVAPAARPIAQRAGVVSDAGPGVLLATQHTGTFTIRARDQLERVGFLPAVLRTLSERDLLQLIPGFRIRHVRNAETPEGKDTAQARGQTTRGGVVLTGQPPVGGGPALTPPSIILPTTGGIRIRQPSASPALPPPCDC